MCIRDSSWRASKVNRDPKLPWSDAFWKHQRLSHYAPTKKERKTGQVKVHSRKRIPVILRRLGKKLWTFI
eukprot:5926764-Amphidinium_carterae.1